MPRTLIVARMDPSAEVDVSRIFAASDATSLPLELGVRHRSLYRLDDVYLHLVDLDGDPDERLRAARDLPGFREISAQLEPYIRPYNPATWRSPQDAMAREFYRFTPSTRKDIA